VVIAGGGVAGVEAMLALSTLAGGLVEVELLAPTDEFVYRPMLVAEPFGSAKPVRLTLERVAREAGAGHTRDALAAVDPRAHTVTTAEGATLDYGALLIALGAKPTEAVPGALTFSGEAERRQFADLLSALGRRGTQRLAFVVPREVTWSIAAYELALLTAAERAARRLSGVEITLITHESAPLKLFGAAASQLVAARLEESGIGLHLSSVARRFERGELQLSDGHSVTVDAAVALPSLVVPPLPGLPQRKHGFVVTDAQMHVAGLNDVWAAGDATSFPIKQGGLAAQQADVAARSIAARAGAHVPIEPFQPVLRAALITGGTPEFFRTPLAGGQGGVASVGHALWWPPEKLAGKYLAPYIAPTFGEEPSEELVDVDPSRDPDAGEAKHVQAVDLVLAAAEADVRIGDYEGAIRWLSLVEELNLVIPPSYVARRHEWRRQLDPGAAPDAAVKRMDPRFDSPAAAISDLQRRLGWLREIEHRTEEEMGRHLSHLDDGIAELISLSRRAGIDLAGHSEATHPKPSAG
jgi:sulfide:quinone oxidoreductase